MRTDMKKLLCERERRRGYSHVVGGTVKGEKRAEQRYRDYDYEDLPSGGKISIKRRHSGLRHVSKYLDENLNPLKKFLKSACGRLWDDVYSEIKAVCPNDSAVNAHIYEHLFDFVDLDAYIGTDGVVYRAVHNQVTYLRKTEMERLESTSRWPAFFVDPAGYLRQAPQKVSWKSQKKKERKERLRFERKISDSLWAVKIDGIWFEATLKPIPDRRERAIYGTTSGLITGYTYEQPCFTDVWLPCVPEQYQPPGYRKNSDYWEKTTNSLRRQCTEYYGAAVYAYSKRQMSSQEIRKLNLRNS